MKIYFVMMTTLFFIQLIAFQIYYVTSRQVKSTHPPAYLPGILQCRQAYRMMGLALILLITVLFIVRYGWMSGICASIVGWMGIGSLVVLLNPFRYVNAQTVVVLFLLFLMLEFLI